MAEQVEESMEIRTVKGKKYASAELVIRRARELAGAGNKPTREHRAQAHKELTSEQVEEGRESEFSANNAMSSTASHSSTGEKKGRLKNKKTGATVGIYPSLAHAQKVHDKHPDKKNLMVEEVEELDELSKTTLGSYVKKAADQREKMAPDHAQARDKDFKGEHDHYQKKGSPFTASQVADRYKKVVNKRTAGMGKAISKLTKESTVFSFVQEMIEARPVVQEAEVKQPLSFSEYRVLYEECLESLDKEINEKKKILMDKCKDIELDESPWDIPKKSSIDWGSDKKNNVTHHNGVTVHKATDKPNHHVEPTESPAPKRGRGRPAGSYGKYKVSRTPEEKAAIGAKVHGNASRQASYSATIEARRKMNSVIKDKHASA